MLRLALPVLCCAALLWGRSGVEPGPRAARSVPEIGAAEPVTPDAADSGSPSSATGLDGPDAVTQAEDPRPPDDPLPPDADGLRQHDVRDLVAMAFDIEELAMNISGETKAKAGSITTRTNVLEVLAPEDIQLQVERFLEEKRRIGTCVLRIHPAADLVVTTEEYEQLQASLRQGTSIPADAFEEPPEPAQPFEIDSLVEVTLQTLGEGVRSITPQGRNLVVLAEPAAHARIADFLDDLRSNVEAESR